MVKNDPTKFEYTNGDCYVTATMRDGGKRAWCYINTDHGGKTRLSFFAKKYGMKVSVISESYRYAE